MQQEILMNWVIIPMLIFLARLVDVSLATVRHILIFRGQKTIVPFIGFVEVLIWLIAIMQVMNNLKHPVSYVAWALGFAVGTYVGMIIEERMALGFALVRVVVPALPEEFLHVLKKHGIGYTLLKGEGAVGLVHVVLIVVKRRNIMQIITWLNQYHRNAFYTVEDIKSSERGIFPRKAGTIFSNRK